MYEARQNKEKVSRRIGKLEKREKSMQRFSDAENRTNLIPIRKNIQFYTLSRENLRKVLGPVPDFGSYTAEAHHIIPKNLIEESYGSGNTDDDIEVYDRQWNGIFLPDTPKENDDNREDNGKNLPYHRNNVLNHNSYDDFVRKELNNAGIKIEGLKSDNADIYNVAGRIRGIITNMGGVACLDEITYYDSSSNSSTEQYQNRRKPEPRKAAPKGFSHFF